MTFSSGASQSPLLRVRQVGSSICKNCRRRKVFERLLSCRQPAHQFERRTCRASTCFRLGFEELDLQLPDRELEVHVDIRDEIQLHLLRRDPCFGADSMAEVPQRGDTSRDLVDQCG
jgi:hypothetical protein